MMLYSNTTTCLTRNQFDIELANAYELALNTDYPMRLMGHCSPTHSNGGDGTGGIMFTYFLTDKQIIYHVRANFVIERDVFDLSYDITRRLRRAGKLIGFSDWQEDEVTHVVSIPWMTANWDYGMIATDVEAVHYMLAAEPGVTIRSGRLTL